MTKKKAILLVAYLLAHMWWVRQMRKGKIMETQTQAASGKMGTEELTRIVDAVLDGVDFGKVIVANGKDYIKDLPAAFSALPTIAADVAAVVAGIKSFPGEIADLDPTEAEALGAHVMARLSIGNAHAVAIADAAIGVAAASLKLIRVLATASPAVA